MSTEEVVDPTEPVPTETGKKKGKKKKEVEAAAEPKPFKITDRSRIREFLADKQTFKIDEIVELVGGTKANASTTITLLLKKEKAGKEGPIPFAYDKTAKVYNRIDPNAAPAETPAEETPAA